MTRSRLLRKVAWWGVGSAGVGHSGVAPHELAPELLAATATGARFTRRNFPRSFAMPDGSRVAIGALADVGSVETDLHLNPHNKRSAHHRPIGRGAIPGVPGGCATVGGAYDAPGPIWSRGRLGVVSLFTMVNTTQGKKYCYKVDAGNSTTRTIADEAGAPANNKLPIDLKLPNGVTFPATAGDDVIFLWPRDGLGTDIGDLIFNFEDVVYTGKRRYEFPIGELDYVDGTSDIYDRGSSASRLRLPGTILRGFEINPTNPAPIRHALQVTVTANDNQPESLHLLNAKMVWPAYGMDSAAASPGNNGGDLPYGTRVYIPWSLAGLRNTLGLSARGLVLWDCFVRYGFYIVDGQGEQSNGGAVMRLRVDQDVANTGSVQDDVSAQLAIMLPYLYPLRNPVSHADPDAERWADGYCYAGGGGPIDATSINTAWDR